MGQLENGGTLFIVGPNNVKERYRKELQELHLKLALKDCEVIWISLSESSSKTIWSGVFQQLDQYDNFKYGFKFGRKA